MPTQDNPLEALTQVRKVGTESFRSTTLEFGFPLMEFWQWSSSDLITNTTRGRLAEFLVAKALGLDAGIRTEWDAYDLRTPSGLRIEVKSSAYLQSWRQLRLSPVSFRIPLTRAWKEEERCYEAAPLRQADVYVFALLAHTDKSTVDALNLDQWRFYVVATAKLTARGTATSISLRSLQLFAQELSWGELAAGVRATEANE